jgi:hypothetical protein
MPVAAKQYFGESERWPVIVPWDALAEQSFFYKIPNHYELSAH